MGEHRIQAQVRVGDQAVLRIVTIPADEADVMHARLGDPVYAHERLAAQFPSETLLVRNIEVQAAVPGIPDMWVPVHPIASGGASRHGSDTTAANAVDISTILESAHNTLVDALVTLRSASDLANRDESGLDSDILRAQTLMNIAAEILSTDRLRWEDRVQDRS